MDTKNQKKLKSYLKAGHVYRRGDLAYCSKAIDRDLIALVNQGSLEKIGPGLYYSPAHSRFGVLPPQDADLVSRFLKEKRFLLYSWSQYNALGLGLTQLYNRVVVYNKKRHGLFKLGNKEFDFKNFARGFPKKLTPEFLLVDLLNNLSQLSEDTDQIKSNIKQHLLKFNAKKVIKNAEEYGKVATRYFLKEIYY